VKTAVRHCPGRRLQVPRPGADLERRQRGHCERSREGVRGLRNDVSWYRTIGPDYVAASFHVAHEADRDACLLMNDFGYETVDQYGNRPEVKRRATLQVIDRS